MPTRSVPVLVLVAGLVLRAGLLGAEEPPAVRLDCTPQAFPALAIQGDDVSRYRTGKPAGFRGFADPCLRRDPQSGDLWLAYSWPHMEHLGGGPFDYAVGVETHLASSADGGRTWERVQVLWPRTPARFAERGTGAVRDGFVSHEVPNLLPCTIDGEPAWVGVRLDYFLARKGNYRARDNLSFCLRLRAAPDPRRLADAPQVTFGHSMSSPECEVDVDFCAFSKDFPPAFIPNEPTLCWRDGRLYLVFVCMTFQGSTPDFPRSFVAVCSTEPKGEVRAWKWRYHGKLCSHPEAVELGGESLTQIELAEDRSGKLLAFLTPEAWDAAAAKEFGGDAFGGILHRGCAVVEVASLEKPALARRPDGALARRAFLYSSASSAHGPGAAAYDPASATGVLFTLRHIAAKSDLSWSLHATGLHP